MQFAGKFPISFAKEFHGKMFRDEEIAFVYIYDHPVEIDRLTLQQEEVEEVQWFDLEETYQQCRQHRDKFCVPIFLFLLYWTIVIFSREFVLYNFFDA